MPEREVESPAAGPTAERQRALERGPRALAARSLPAVMADRRVLDPEPLAQLERLREVARGDLHLVALLARSVAITGLITSTCGEFVRSIQTLTLTAADAPAASAATTTSADSAPSTGLIGSARLVRASSSVDRQREAVARRYGAIAGWR